MKMTRDECFWTKVNKEGANGCWEWKAGKFKSGYGQFFTGEFLENGNTKQAKAHRYSWELMNGPVPDGLQVLHRCDNRACVNPEHLFLGTHEDNMADMAAKGRRKGKGLANPNTVKGSKVGTAKLSEDDVKAIRSDGRTQQEIASDYGVAQTAVGRIKARRTWAHVA